MRNKRKQLGVTLVEMMVVVTIAALMLGLAVPATNMLLNSFESESGAKSIISAAMASARAIAAKEQRYAGIRFQKRYDPTNPDPLNCSQYMIFIVEDDLGNLANGFRAVDGIQPIKLPDSIGVMDRTQIDAELAVNSAWEPDPTNFADLTDLTAFSIVFSPSGKLIIHKVRVRNRDGQTINETDSYDNVFNKISQIAAGYGMFLQDDYYTGFSGNPPNFGLRSEYSRNNFIIYDTKKFKQAYNNSNAYSGYLNQLKPIYINPYTGTIINEK